MFYLAARLTFQFRFITSELLYHFYVLMNLFLCLDLRLMLKEPFSPKDKRTTGYLVISTVASILISFVQSRYTVIHGFIGTSFFLVYLIVTVWTTVYYMLRIPNSGLSY